MTLAKPPMLSVPIPSVNKWNGVGVRPQLAFVCHVAQCHTLDQLDNWFRDPTNRQASSNAGCGPDGTLHEYVDPDAGDAPFANGLVKDPDAGVRALMAKAGGTNLNYVTYSLEFVGVSAFDEITLQGTPFVLTDAQLQQGAALCAYVLDRAGLPADESTILGHYEIYSGHAGCPGWDRAGWLRFVGKVQSLLAPQPTPTPQPQPGPDYHALWQHDETVIDGLTRQTTALASENARLAGVVETVRRAVAPA